MAEGFSYFEAALLPLSRQEPKGSRLSKSKSAPKRILVLLDGKLIGLDSVLPIAMALRAEAPEARIVFLFLNAAFLRVASSNYVLHQGLLSTGEVKVLSPGETRLFGKAVAFARLITWCVRLLSTRTWTLAFTDAARFPIWPLALSTRCGGGGVFCYAKRTFPASSARFASHRKKAESRDGDDVFRDPGDVFLVHHPDQIDEYRAQGVGNAIVIGTSRQYPEWLDFLDRTETELGVLTSDGKPVDPSAGPIISVFFSGDVTIPSQQNLPRETLSQILALSAEEAPDARVLIKPHPNCDVQKLEEQIASSARKDALITFAHPQLLARVSRMTVFDSGSQAMNDTYVEGTPTVEATVYTSETLKHGTSMCDNPGRIDGSTPDRLREAMRTMVRNHRDLPIPSREHLIWAKPPRLVPALIEGIANSKRQRARG